ncbi:PREDICTED: E3 ubiquitin-protein ligase ATL41-like [Erythranthe guttata]|nr:PREDICTED: E3 ubiquitin-protein ligase ATL41-like [Erythranthe guttata]|eukprot:XP_012834020.1 PREDICTED: E3 ubiquitin-protein ligase ATL41-like [Erythranthe guttata]
MGDYQDRLQPTLYCDLSHVEFTTPEETDDHNNRSEINLNFSWKVDFSEWIIPHAVQQYSTNPQVVRRFNESTTNFSFGVSRMQFRCLSELRGVMEFELRGVLDNYDFRRNVAEYVIVTTLASFDIDILAEGRVLDFYFDVLVDNQQIVFGPGEIYEEEYNCMVPAEDSSIMSSLKRVAVDSNQNISCSICLEDLSSGGDNNCEEALSMPCSHVYHGDCIKKWLTISHYCPLCRFEMPTTN